MAGRADLTSGATRLHARVRDVSSGGIGIEAPRLGLAPGSLVRVELALPGLAPALAIDGEVVWHARESGRAGISFGSLDPGVVELLQAFASGRL